MNLEAGSYGTPEIRTYASGAQVHIGKYCSISDGVVMLAGGEHHVDWVTTSPIVYLTDGKYELVRPADIVIGNDVWIGFGATILGGVTVGDGAVIGARALVRENVAPYSIVGGVPARLIRYRHTPAQIASLLALRWWDWDTDKIMRFRALLCSPDVDSFLKAAEKAHT